MSMLFVRRILVLIIPENVVFLFFEIVKICAEMCFFTEFPENENGCHRNLYIPKSAENHMHFFTL